MHKITIKHTSNGYIVKCNSQADHEEPGALVIEEAENKDGKRTAFAELVYILADEFGLGYDGFSKSNLNIRWDRKGDELE